MLVCATMLAEVWTLEYVHLISFGVRDGVTSVRDRNQYNVQCILFLQYDRMLESIRDSVNTLFVI